VFIYNERDISMGIKRFQKFFSDAVSSFLLRKKKATDDDETKSITEFYGKYCIIDAYSKLYSGIIGIRSKGKELMGTTIINKSHLHVIFNFSIFLLKHGIIPIFVFDGKSPKIKTITLEKRKNIRLKIDEKISTMTDKEQNVDNPEYIKYFKRNFTITLEQINECKNLLNAIGVPFVQAKGEADVECVQLMNFLGDKVAFIVSDDTDHVVFGAKRVLCNFTNKDEKTICFDLEKIRETFLNKINKIKVKNKLETIKSFQYEDFIKFVTILGTDYNKGIKTKNIDDLLTYLVLSDFNIEKMIVSMKEKDIIVPDEFINNWESAYKYYYCCKYTCEKYLISYNIPNKDKFVQILTELQIPKKRIEMVHKDLFMSHFILTKV
jgi:flap endonuclease-1